MDLTEIQRDLALLGDDITEEHRYDVESRLIGRVNGLVNHIIRQRMLIASLQRELLEMKGARCHST